MSTEQSALDTIDTLKRRYEQGASLRELARDFKMSHESVRRRLIGAGVRMRPRGEPRAYALDEDTYAQLRKEYEGGMTIAEMANKWHVSRDALRSALARAKVNLHLHVLGRREDGYHLLDSLVVFPELGDRLEAEPAAGLSLSVAGPFADQLPSDGGNLVLRAAEALAARAPGRGAALRLEKALPVAGGIGGGSADAAAALRALSRLWGLRPGDAEGLALGLGADVPVCLGAPRPAMMGGIGEVLRPAPALPALWLTLANPGLPVATAEVFRRLERRDGRAAEAPARFETAAALADWLAAQSNMLEAAAEAVAPAVGALRREIGGLEGCLLARMSGSGGTCFGLFAEDRAALAAAEALRARGVWAAAAPVRASAPLAAVGG